MIAKLGILNLLQETLPVLNVIINAKIVVEALLVAIAVLTQIGQVGPVIVILDILKMVAQILLADNVI